MTRIIQRALVLALAAGLFPCVAAAQDTVEESSTAKLFPASVSFRHDGEDYTLDVTGVGVRKKFFFKVYAIAHYMDGDEFVDNETAFAAALSDGRAKQITMDFARDVDVEKIQNAFEEGFKKNATSEELEEISALVDRFTGYFDKKVLENQTYVLRWLPGGVVVPIVQDEEMEPVVNITFAKVLWRVWLGEDSIVDRKKLVKMAIPE